MRTQLISWSQRIAQWGPWTAVTGTFLLIAGLIWDVTIHEGDPSLAAHESVFTIDNPAHVVFLSGIALIVIGMGLFMIDELRLMRAQRRNPRTGIVAFLAVAFLVLAVGGAAAAAQTQLVASSTTVAAGHVHSASPGASGASGAPAGHHATFVTSGPGCAPEGTPPTAAQQAAAAQLTAQVKGAWSPTLTPAQAVALGYRAPVTTPANPTLVHYVDPALVKDTTHLMDPNHPQALVFLHLHDGATVLGGVLFTAPIGTGPCPGGALTLWHYHKAGAVREMIHVWLFDNPSGAFSTGTGGKAGLLVAARELEPAPNSPSAAPQT